MSRTSSHALVTSHRQKATDFTRHTRFARHVTGDAGVQGLNTGFAEPKTFIVEGVMIDEA